MTQAEAENLAQLNQLQNLKAARDRVLKLYRMMLPLVENLALEGDSLARYLTSELEKAEDAMALANMNAHEFIADNEEAKS